MSGKDKRGFGLTSKAKEDLIGKFLRRTAKDSASSPLHAATGKLASREIPEEFTRFDCFPNYEKLLAPQLAAKRFGLENPFFKVHEGVAGCTTQIAGRQFINFSSYNYLCLNGHPQVNKAARDAIERWGTSVSASRLVSGERAVQRDLEAELADMYGVEECVVFVSGHATNVTTIGYLFGAKDLILHDALIHNSVLQGIQLSGAHRRPFPHNDWQALEGLLTEIRGQYERVLIVLEGLYSMDGDLPDLPRFIEVKRRHKAFLMVDEAHALGVLGAHGRGIAEHYGINGREVDIWMGTLSKTLAGCGGYIAGERALVEHLRYLAPGFLYSVGISPPLAAASLEALRLMQGEPERVERLRQRSRLFYSLARDSGINVGSCAGLSVIPAITRSSLRAVKVSGELFNRGVNVQPIIYPAVEEKAARLRFFITSGHTDDQIRFSVKMLVESMS